MLAHILSVRRKDYWIFDYIIYSHPNGWCKRRKHTGPPENKVSSLETLHIRLNPLSFSCSLRTWIESKSIFISSPFVNLMLSGNELCVEWRPFSIELLNFTFYFSSVSSIFCLVRRHWSNLVTWFVILDRQSIFCVRSTFYFLNVGETL